MENRPNMPPKDVQNKKIGPCPQTNLSRIETKMFSQYFDVLQVFGKTAYLKKTSFLYLLQIVLLLQFLLGK